MSFEVSRLRRADWIVGGGAVALFVFMFFFKWFGASSSVSLPTGGSFNASASVNAWHSLSNTRWLLLITLVVALGVVALVATSRTLNSPVAPSVIVAALGLLSAIFVLYRIIDHPHGGVSTGVASFSYGAKVGLYLGFVACLAILYGGYLKMQEEGTSLSDVRDQASRAVSGLTESGGAPGAPSEPPAGEASGYTTPTPPPASSEPPLPPPASTPPGAGAA